MEKVGGPTIYEVVDRQVLVDIVDCAQKRTVSEEVDLLLTNSPDPTGWLTLQLKTDLIKGIRGDEADLQQRREQYGTNHKEPAKPPSFFSLLLEALDDFILKILIVASLLSIGIEGNLQRLCSGHGITSESIDGVDLGVRDYGRSYCVLAGDRRK